MALHLSNLIRHYNHDFPHGPGVSGYELPVFAVLGAHGNQVNTALLVEANGDPVQATLRRDGAEFAVNVTPARSFSRCDGWCARSRQGSSLSAISGASAAACVPS